MVLFTLSRCNAGKELFLKQMKTSSPELNYDGLLQTLAVIVKPVSPVETNFIKNVSYMHSVIAFDFKSTWKFS